MAPDESNLERLGSFIRSQRQRADLSLRDLADRTSVSNPYLSQIERGLHQPSVRILKSIAVALRIPAATLLAEAGLVDDEGDGRKVAPATEIAIEADPELTDEQRRELLATYRRFRVANIVTPSDNGSASDASTSQAHDDADSGLSIG